MEKMKIRILFREGGYLAQVLNMPSRIYNSSPLLKYTIRYDGKHNGYLVNINHQNSALFNK